jgi:hypothetical protein
MLVDPIPLSVGTAGIGVAGQDSATGADTPAISPMSATPVAVYISSTTKNSDETSLSAVEDQFHSIFSSKITSQLTWTLLCRGSYR